MITKTEKKRIKKHLGHRYVSLIQAELTAKNELNKNGNPYASAQITNVMNGVGHAVIEDAIYRAVETKKALKNKRKEILKTA